MAVYGIGAYYDEDITNEFVKNKCVCIGHEPQNAPTLFAMLRSAKMGDIVYIKSISPKTNDKITVKAIGHIIGEELEHFNFTNGKDMGIGRKVIWIRNNDLPLNLTLKKEDRVNNVYFNTMYEEYSKDIIEQIINLI